jgi:hypothetical protein
MPTTGSREPSPTTIDGVGYCRKEKCERLLEEDVMWEVAPESKYHSLVGGCCSVAVVNAEASDWVSQEGRPAMGW